MYCWGNNTAGQAGQGRPRGVEVPQVIFSDADSTEFFSAKQVVGADGHTCAIGSDDRVHCWGFGDGLGDGTLETRDYAQPVVGRSGSPFAAKSIVALDTHSFHACAVDQDGDIWCWGGAGPVVPDDGSVATRINSGIVFGDLAVGLDAACALARDRSVHCWGNNSVGQLGRGAFEETDVPTPVEGLADVSEVYASHRTFCARTEENELLCWGENIGGAISPDTGHRFEPTRVAEGVEQAWLGLHSVCWRQSGGVLCRGRNLEGQFGDGNSAPASSIGEGALGVAGFDAIERIESHRQGGCGIRGGEVVCFGGSLLGHVPRASLYLESPTVVANSANSGVQQVVASRFTGCIRRTDGFACWGRNGAGQLGSGDIASRSTGRDVTLSGITDIAAGEQFSCAIAARQAYCWGSNFGQRLGRPGPNVRDPMLVERGGEETDVEVGAVHACAITAAGSVVCWGSNSFGELGRPASPSEAPAATNPLLTNTTQLALGHRHTCALRDGQVWCFGRNSAGELGDGTSNTRHTPALVERIAAVRQVVAGTNHTCALLLDGAVSCWGSNLFGQLGTGGTDDSNVPTNVALNRAADSIVAGGTHTCATVGGAVYCWGDGTHYQTGLGTTELRRTPSLIEGLRDIVELTSGSFGSSTTCARRVSPGANDAVCWGSNFFGSAGDGSPLYFAPTPVALP